MLDRLRYGLKALLRRRHVEGDLEAEIAHHLELETRKNVARGMSEDEARRQARIAFGGVEPLREAHRDHRGTRWLEDLLSDARYALRSLAHNPALALTVVVTLALGIGADSAIFSVVNAVLIRPLPFARPSRLVMAGENNRDFGWHMAEAAPANYLDWRSGIPAFADAAAWADWNVPRTIMAGDEPRLETGARVTGNFFSVLGVAPRGRGFTDDETWTGGVPVAVISDRLWRALGADPALVGKSLSIDGIQTQVVGIAPAGWHFPDPNTDLWEPIGWDRKQAADASFRRAHWLRVVARLKDGATLGAASAQLHALMERLKREYPETNRIMEADLAPLQRFIAGDARLPLLVLLAAVGLLLLIACVNIGNLLLVRAAARSRELAIRGALGAGRGRLLRQSLTEAMLLSLIGSVLGLALGWWGTRSLVRMAPRGMLPVGEVGLDVRVAAYVVLVCIAAGIAFGIMPGLWSSRRAPGDALGSHARGGSIGPRTRAWGERLAIAEVAMALVLTAGAGLLLRSYDRLRHVDPGFNPDHVLATTISLPTERYNNPDKVRAFFNTLVDRTSALPGVTQAAAVTQLPLTQVGWSSEFTIEGPSGGSFGASLLHRQVTPGYFKTMQVPLLSGRGFTDEDRGAPYVVLINQAFAKSYFKGQNPIGQRITFDRVPDSTSTWRTIVGVVGDEHQSSPATPPGIEALAPFNQETSTFMHVVARTTGDPLALAPAMRSMVRDLDPRLAIENIAPMPAIAARSMARDRFLTLLLSLFGVIGLALAIVGVYGVVAQLARLQTRDMGIRIALGASRGGVQWMVLRRGLRLGAAGVGVGAVLSLLSGGALRKLLYDIAPSDPVTFAAVAGLLLAATGLASWLPAFRAARVDLLSVLREE